MGLVSVQMGLNVLTESNMTLKVQCQFYLNLNDDIQANSVRDSFRLGNFKKDQTHTLPLLLKLNYVGNQISVLSNRTFIKNENAIIKSDMTPEESKLNHSY